jgi:hypothetical protein
MDGATAPRTYATVHTDIAEAARLASPRLRAPFSTVSALSGSRTQTRADPLRSFRCSASGALPSSVFGDAKMMALRAIAVVLDLELPSRAARRPLAQRRLARFDEACAEEFDLPRVAARDLTRLVSTSETSAERLTARGGEVAWPSRRAVGRPLESGSKGLRRRPPSASGSSHAALSGRLPEARQTVQNFTA